MDNSDGSFGSADLVYGGNVNAWIKFANSLKLRIGIIMADYDNAYAQTTVENAVTSGIFTSSDDDALFTYLSATPNTNPLFEDLILSGRKDFVPTNTIIDKMNSLTDPRLGLYFTQTDTSTEVGVQKLAYVGGSYGYSSTYANYSHISDQMQVPEFPGILMTYSEVQFYLAEADERGYSVGVTAEAAYNEGITASILFWGGSLSEVPDYLGLPNVAYTTAPGTWQEKIGTQAWIAFYTRGLEAFDTYRRLDYPTMNEAPDAFTGGPVPLRFTYPINEQTLNKANYTAASDAIGGDDLMTPLFWDLGFDKK
jgi:hypothetical protein